MEKEADWREDGWIVFIDNTGMRLGFQRSNCEETILVKLYQFAKICKRLNNWITILSSKKWNGQPVALSLHFCNLDLCPWRPKIDRSVSCHVEVDSQNNCNINPNIKQKTFQSPKQHRKKQKTIVQLTRVLGPHPHYIIAPSAAALEAVWAMSIKKLFSSARK